ncbi:MAG: ClbS/DfsB family four-helix bundle protein [Candidatus Eiseniibacteriota bacterium]|nr:MAG: ClbS/DfsB family four-helix bundle protein [Candidatus Eisenbacteria bacterium]
MDRAQLLRRLEESWNALKASYTGLSHSLMTEPCVTGTWSVKDIIAHVTSWEEESLAHLPIILAGERPPRYSVTYGGIDAFNARTTGQRRSLSLSWVLRQRDEVHRRLVDFIESVPEEQFTRETRFRRRLRLDTHGHYLKHAEAIRQWRRHRA